MVSCHGNRKTVKVYGTRDAGGYKVLNKYTNKTNIFCFSFLFQCPWLMWHVPASFCRRFKDTRHAQAVTTRGLWTSQRKTACCVECTALNAISLYEKTREWSNERQETHFSRLSFPTHLFELFLSYNSYQPGRVKANTLTLHNWSFSSCCSSCTAAFSHCHTIYSLPHTYEHFGACDS